MSKRLITSQTLERSAVLIEVAEIVWLLAKYPTLEAVMQLPAEKVLLLFVKLFGIEMRRYGGLSNGA